MIKKKNKSPQIIINKLLNIEILKSSSPFSISFLYLFWGFNTKAIVETNKNGNSNYKQQWYPQI